MKTLYLDCTMGAAGDMITAALLDLFPDRQAICSELNSLGIPGVEFHAETVRRCGIAGAGVHVHIHGQEEEDCPAPHGHEHAHIHEHEHHHEHAHGHIHGHHHEHHHSSMADIAAIVEKLSVSDSVKARVMEVYNAIARAESAAHGVEVTEIHFHEVGMMDAVADITAACYLAEKLGAERIIASPITTGYGQICCAHGILPVPAPATANLLIGVPIRAGQIEGELCTPTGAALVKALADSFGTMPDMTLDAIGYGMGKRDFPAANCVRSLLGSM